MFGFGQMELLVVGGLLTLLFGAGRVPGLARQLKKINGTLAQLKQEIKQLLRLGL